MKELQTHKHPSYIRILQGDDRTRFTKVMTHHFPEIEVGTGKRVLDFGCGSSTTPGGTKEQLESYGYTWVGIDMEGGRASALANGHHLPFHNCSFDLVVSLAVLEHMQKPWLVARELGRVSQPGALFLGITAFLEAEHTNSYFHMSHLGIASLLDEGGFETVAIWPSWTVQEAMSWFTFIEGGGRKRFLYRPFHLLARTMETIMTQVRSRRLQNPKDRVIDQLRFSGSIGFAARQR